MEVQVAQLTPVLVEFSVTVEHERLKQELDKAYLELQKRAHVRGFRPGKAPREVLMHFYGSSITNDVCSKLVDETLNKAFTDKNIQPLSKPEIEVQKASAKEPLQYKARFEVRPEIDELKWEGLEASKPKVTVSETAIDEAIEEVRKNHGTLNSPEPARPVQVGDVVAIDFVTKVKGKQLEESKGLTAEIGAGKLLKEIEDVLIHSSVGDEKEVTVRFPDDHANTKLRGSEVVFSIKLVDLKERKLPALDDEFAKDVGEYETLAALRAATAEQLKEQAEEAAEQQLVIGLVAALCKENPIEIPSSLMQQQAQLTWQELQQEARRNGQRLTMTPELEQQISVDSEVKVRAGLLMAEIAKRNGIQINEDDIEKGLQELAVETGKNIARVRADYREASRRQMLIGMILEDKVLDLLIAKAVIKEVEPTT